MAVLRERPYSQFNFIVQIDGGPDARSVEGGFQEVSGLGMEITSTEYRNGNERDNAPRKMSGLYKVPDVTLKRGVIGDLNTFLTWTRATRENGSVNNMRTVTITLQNEDQTVEAMKWVLRNARPLKYSGPTLSGKGSEVAMEELVLAAERIDFE